MGEGKKNVPKNDNNEVERITDCDMGINRIQIFGYKLNVHSQSEINWDFGATAVVEEG
jgi:hypothetical protein